MPRDLIYRIQADAFVLIAHKVHDTMKRFTQGAEGETEAGGIFIGSYRGKHIEIFDCTVPLRRDVRKRFLLDRKDRGHRLAAMKAWSLSLGTETYVGEWHTHPEDVPIPSSIDRGTWREITMKRSVPAVFIIMGRAGIWGGIGKSGMVAPMELVSD